MESSQAHRWRFGKEQKEDQEDISVQESTIEEFPAETLVNGGDHPSSKMTNDLTATFPNLPKIEKGTEVNKTASKIIRKKNLIKTKI